MRRSSHAIVAVVHAQDTSTVAQRARQVSTAVALLFGVLFMHALLLSPPAETHAQTVVAGTGDAPDHHANSMRTVTAMPAIAATCDHQCGGEHNGMHTCPAVIAVIAGILLVRPQWSTAYPSTSPQSLFSLGGASCRAPPWTTLTLSELSVLRV